MHSDVQGPARLKSPGFGSVLEGSGSQNLGARPWPPARASEQENELERSLDSSLNENIIIINTL